MPLLVYTTLTSSGTIAQGEAFVESRGHLFSLLHERGETLISSKIISEQRLHRIPKNKLAEFFLKLHVLMDAGQPLLQAIDDIKASKIHPKLSYVLSMISFSLKQGMNFTSCLEKFPKLFDTIVVDLVDTGMSTGKLIYSLKRIEVYLNDIIDHKQMLRKSLTYPLFLGITLLFLFVLFSQFLIPQLISYLHDMGIKELPLASRSLIWFSSNMAIINCISLLLGVLILFIFSSWHFSHKCKALLTIFLMKLPLVGSNYTRFSMILWLQAMGELYGVGIDLKNCLTKANKTVRNPLFQSRFHEMEEKILWGKSLSDGMQETQLLSPFVTALCDLGLKSGTLSKRFLQAYHFEKDELRNTTNYFLKVLEPMLITLMGSFLLWIVMGIILPLYDHLNL